MKNWKGALLAPFFVTLFFVTFLLRSILKRLISAEAN